MRRLVILALLPVLAHADWLQFRSGPFEVITDAGAKPARETLLWLEEYRHVLGQTLGDNDLQTPQRLRILISKRPPGPTGKILETRDGYALLFTPGEPVSTGLNRALTRLFLDANTARMPAPIESGLIDLFSTMQITGIKILLGSPPANPTKDWARLQLLATSEEYYGKLRVILYNLRKGVPEDVAYRNAIGRSAAELNKQVNAYFAAGKFTAVQASSRPLSLEDFHEKQIPSFDAQLAVADLMLGQESRSAYEALIKQGQHVPEAEEGLAMLAARAHQPDEALRHFSAAIKAGAGSARCYLEYGRIEKDDGLAMAALKRAGELNPKLAEPYFLRAQRQKNKDARIAELKVATQRAPRELAYWKALADACIDNGDFRCAAQAWTSAEQAASNPADRARMHASRMAVEQQRLDYEEAERKRVATEKEAEIAKLKAEAIAEVRALEARANKGQAPAQSAQKVVPWWDGPKADGKVHGTLKQVDCLGKQLRVTVQGDDQKFTKLLIKDPGQVTLMGDSGSETLSCGPQKGRRVSVEYFARPNARLGTAGEVAVIEFH